MRALIIALAVSSIVLGFTLAISYTAMPDLESSAPNSLARLGVLSPIIIALSGVLLGYTLRSLQADSVGREEARASAESTMATRRTGAGGAGGLSVAHGSRGADVD